MHRFFSILFLTVIAVIPVSFQAGPMFAEKKSNYMPELPPISMISMTSKLIKMQPRKGARFHIIIPIKNIINMAITRNKNTILSELIPGFFLNKIKSVTVSNNSFEDAPIDGQVIIQGNIQSIKVVASDFTPNEIILTVKPFSKGRPLEASQGSGAVILNSSCVTNRIVCALGCSYVIMPDKACRRKLGIL